VQKEEETIQKMIDEGTVNPQKHPCSVPVHEIERDGRPTPSHPESKEIYHKRDGKNPTKRVFFEE